MKHGQLFVVSLCVMLVLSILAGCAGTSTSTGTSKVETPAPETDTPKSGEGLTGTYKVLVVAEDVDDYTDPITGAKLSGWASIVKPFEERNPGLHIEFVPVPWDGIEQKWQTVAETGEVDVMHLAAGDNNNYGSRGFLTPLDDFIKNDKNFDPIATFGEGLWNSGAMQVDNLHYGLPKSGYSFTIVFNKKIFDDFGVPYLTEDSTWEEILEKAQKLTGKNPKSGSGTYGFYTGQGWGIFPYLQNYLNKKVYSFLDWNTDKMIGGDLSTLKWNYANNPGIEKAYKWFKDMANYMPPGWNTKQGEEKFYTADSNLAMSVTDGGGNFKRMYSANQLDLLANYGVIPLPAYTDVNGKKLRSVANIHTWAMPKGAKHKEASWEIIKYLSSIEVSEKAYKETWQSPIYPDAVNWLIPEDPYSKMNIKALQESHGYGKEIYLSAYGQFYTLQIDLLSKYALKTTQDLKGEMQKIQDYLDNWTKEAVKNGTR